MFGSSFGKFDDVMMVRGGSNNVTANGNGASLVRYSDFGVQSPIYRGIGGVLGTNGTNVSAPCKAAFGQLFVTATGGLTQNEGFLWNWNPMIGSIAGTNSNYGKSANFITKMKQAVGDPGFPVAYSLTGLDMIAPAAVTTNNAAVLVTVTYNGNSSIWEAAHSGALGSESSSWSITTMSAVALAGSTSNIVWTGTQLVYVVRQGLTSGSGYVLRTVGSSSYTPINFSNSTGAGNYISDMCLMPDGRLFAYDKVNSTLYVSSDKGLNWTISTAGTYNYGEAVGRNLPHLPRIGAGRVASVTLRAGTALRYQGLLTTGALTDILNFPYWTDVSGGPTLIHDLAYYKGYWIVGVQGSTVSNITTVYWKRTKVDIFAGDTAEGDWEDLPDLRTSQGNIFNIAVLQG